MALIKCPECGKEISEKAFTCPHCGYPICDKSLKESDAQEDVEDKKTIEVNNDIISKYNNTAPKNSSATAIILIIIFVLALLGIIGLFLPDNDRKVYVCQYCGTEMKDNYWSYHDGGYVCYWCDKKYYHNDD